MNLNEYNILHHPALTCNRGRCQCLPHPWEPGLLELWIEYFENHGTLRFFIAITFKKEAVLVIVTVILLVHTFNML